MFTIGFSTAHFPVLSPTNPQAKVREIPRPKGQSPRGISHRTKMHHHKGYREEWHRGKVCHTTSKKKNTKLFQKQYKAVPEAIQPTFRQVHLFYTKSLSNWKNYCGHGKQAGWFGNVVLQHEKFKRNYRWGGNKNKDDIEEECAIVRGQSLVCLQGLCYMYMFIKIPSNK